MELPSINLENAISWAIEYHSNGETFPTKKIIENSIKIKYFPILNYLYSNKPITELKIENNFKENEIIEKIKLNPEIYRINDIPNKILVEIKKSEKKSSNFPNLEKILKKEKIKLEKVIDIEFFEYYESHSNYLKYLNGEQELELLKYSDKKIILESDKSSDRLVLPSHREIIESIKNMHNYSFEKIFLFEDPSKLIDILNENITNIDKKEFSTFKDTEKIHIQMAICSKGNNKNIPILAYFGYGNYYPFTGSLKHKNNRFNRFSQLNNNDKIDVNYYLKEMTKSKTEKEFELKELINLSQLNYFKYFEEKFNFKKRRIEFEKKYSKTKFSDFIDYIMMLEPIFRTKSSALIAYDYNFYN